MKNEIHKPTEENEEKDKIGDEESEDNELVDLDFDQINNLSNEVGNFHEKMNNDKIKQYELETSELKNEGINKLTSKNLLKSEQTPIENQIEESKKYSGIFQKKIKNNFEKIFVKAGELKINKKEKHHTKYSVDTNFISAAQNKKTVFTKVSEQIFSKLLKSKSKVSSYEDMTSDLYLRKISERSDIDSLNKMNSFLERTREYTNKKSININEAKKMNTSNTFVGNSSNKKPTNIVYKSMQSTGTFKVRSPEMYLKDQMKFVEEKENHLNMIRESIKRENNKHMKDKPTISAKSKSLIMNKNREERNVYSRLYQDENFKKKFNMIQKVNIDDNERKKLTDKEISLLVNKLFNDAKNRANAKKINEGKERMEPDIKSIQSMSHSNSFTLNSRQRLSYSQEPKLVSINDYDLTTNSSKLVMIKKFVKDFEIALLNLYKKSLPFTFDDYCDILYYLGFLNYDHKKAKMILIGPTHAAYSNQITKNNIHINNENTDINIEKARNYLNLRDCQDQSIQNKSPEIFLTHSYSNHYETVITEGNKDGNLGKINFGIVYDENTIKKLDKELVLIKDSWRVLTKRKNIEGSEQVEVDQVLLFLLGILGLYKGNFNNTNELNIPNNINNNAEIIVNSKTPKINSRPVPNTISVTQKNSTNATIPLIEMKDNLINYVLPNFKLHKYSYEKRIVKQLKVLFKPLYENRVQYINLQRKERENRRLSVYNDNFDNKFKPSINHRTIQSAEKYRQKLSKYAMDSEPEINEKRKHLRVEEIYDIQRKKKEYDRAIQRKRNEDEKLAECTFTPNLHKQKNNQRSRSYDVTTRLYSHAMNKLLRIKSIYEEQKAIDVSFEKHSKECTFSPETTKLKNEIFFNDPLKNDNLVRKEMERYEKARIEKKLKELILTKGFNTLNRIQNLDDLLNEYKHEEQLAQFRFGNELVKNKDSFSKFHQYTSNGQFKMEKYSHSAINSRKQTCIANNDNTHSPSGNTSSRKHHKKPIFSLAVEFEGQDPIDQLVFYEDDDPILVAEQFCLKNQLQEDAKEKIINMIKQRLKGI